MELLDWISKTLNLNLNRKFCVELITWDPEEIQPVFELLNDGARMVLATWEALYFAGWERHSAMMYTRGGQMLMIKLGTNITLSFEGKFYEFTQNRYGEMQLNQWLSDHILLNF